MKIRMALIFICLLAFYEISNAQGNQGGNGKGKNPPVPFGPPHPELPIDGGISILLIAGACYGAFALRDKINL
jgi:hypothetical protein